MTMRTIIPPGGWADCKRGYIGRLFGDVRPVLAERELWRPCGPKPCDSVQTGLEASGDSLKQVDARASRC